MSLQVWMPLLGNLKNQGLNGMTFSLSGGSAITTDSAGKIGSCYERTSRDANKIQSSSKINLSGDISMCCWAYVSSTVGDTANGLITNHDHSSNTGVGITVKQISSSDYRMSCNTGTGSGRSYNTYYGTTNIKNAWHHLALTYDKTAKELKLWVDGNCEYTLSNYTNSSKADYIDIFNWSTGATPTNYIPLCKLNDVRIYDNCLTPEEVKEISKGLVCHYTLSDLSIVNKNLLGTDSLLTDTAVNVGKNYSQFKSSSDFFGLQAGDTFTVSCYLTCPSVKGGSLRILYYTDGDNRVNVYGTSISAGQSGLVTYTGTLTSALRAYTTMLICILNSNTSIESTDTFYVKNLKIEKFNGNTAYTTSDTSIIYDSSGYCNNGTISGNPSLDSNTPRYNKALLFPANSASTITTPLSIDNNAWTIAFWEKCDWTNTETSNPYILYWNNYIRIRKYSTTARMRALYYYKDSEGTQTNASLYFMNAIGTDTSWKHFVLTFDGSTLKTYLNGTLNVSSDLPSGFSLYDINGDFRLNYTAETIPKSLSDVRVYATALSADDVTALYNLGLV